MNKYYKIAKHKRKSFSFDIDQPINMPTNYNCNNFNKYIIKEPITNKIGKVTKIMVKKVLSIELNIFG